MANQPDPAPPANQALAADELGQIIEINPNNPNPARVPDPPAETPLASQPQDPVVVNVMNGLKRKRHPGLTDAELQNKPDLPLPEDLVLFMGLLGNSPRDGYRRLYLSLQMNEFIEFKADEAVAWEDLGADILPTAVWFRRGTAIQHVRVNTIHLQQSFLQGDLAQSSWGQTNMGPMAGGNGRAAPMGMGWGQGNIMPTVVCYTGQVICGTGGSVLCTGNGGPG